MGVGDLFVDSGNRHRPVVWSRLPINKSLLFLVIFMSCLLKVAMHPASLVEHNPRCPGTEHWKAVEKFVGYVKVNESDIKLTFRKPRESLGLSRLWTATMPLTRKTVGVFQELSTLLAEC